MRAYMALEASMDSKSMKRWQAKKILDVLRPTRGYLHRLKCRMEKVGFVKGDPLLKCVERADTAMLELCMTLHYMTCDGGMGSTKGAPRIASQIGPKSVTTTRNRLLPCHASKTQAFQHISIQESRSFRER
jgi:hypothetical protein